MCDLILFKMALDPMKPQLVVDHRAKKRELETLTLANCDNDVRTFITKMQEKRIKIDALRKDNVKFDDQRWLTLVFEQLANTECPDFLEDVKRQRSESVKDSSKFDSGQFYVKMTNQAIIAFATALDKQLAKKKANKKGTPTTSPAPPQPNQ